MQAPTRKHRSAIWLMPKDEFIVIVKNAKNLGDILRHFNLVNKGGNSNTVKRRIQYENIDISHIKLGSGSTKGKVLSVRKSNDEIFCENGTTNRASIKKRIIRYNLIPYECADCELKDTWNNKKLCLQLEHKNGIPNDHRLCNLCFLCPNCHSQTDTYAGKRFKKSKQPKILKDTHLPRLSRRKVERPSKEELEKLIATVPVSDIAKIYKVADNSIRKWAKTYGIELVNRRGYWQKLNSRARI